MYVDIVNLNLCFILKDSDHKHEINFKIYKKMSDILSQSIIQMRKKQSQPPSMENIQQHFLSRFVSRNFQRQEIDQQSLVYFNKFCSYFCQLINQQTSQNDIMAFVHSINVILKNFDYVNKSRTTYILCLQMFDIFFGILEHIISSKLSNLLAYHLIEIFWPLYDLHKKQFSLEQVIKKINNMKLPTDYQSNLNKQSLPEIWNEAKYALLIDLMIKNAEDDSGKTFLKCYLMIEGQKYLDLILTLIAYTIQDRKIDFFKRILKIYLQIGCSHEVTMTHVQALMNKILRSKQKVQFFSIIAEQIPLQKYYSPNHLLQVSLNILDSIFTQRNISDKSFKALSVISSYLYLLKKANHLVDSNKLISLPSNMFMFLQEGNSKKTTQKKRKSNKSKSKGRKAMSKQKSESKNSRSRSNSRERNMILKNHQIFSSILGGQNNEDYSELEKILKFNQSFEQKHSQKKAQDSQNQNQSSSRIRGLMLPKQQMEKYSKEMKKILKTLTYDCEATKETIGKYIESKDSLFYQLFNQCKNVDSDLQRFQFIVDFIMTVFSRALQNCPSFEISYPISTAQSGIIQLLKLRILQEKKLRRMTPQKIYSEIYQPMHKLVVKDNQMQNFQFMILHMSHKYLYEYTDKVISYLIDSIQTQYETESKKINIMGINLTLINSLVQPWSNVKFTIPLMKDLVSMLNDKFIITNFMHGSQIKQNSLFLTLRRYGGNSNQNLQGDDEEAKMFTKIANMIISLIHKENGKKLSKVLGQMADNNAEKSTYYYMIIIQLSTLCHQYSPVKVTRSQDFEAIVQMKKNNRLGMMLTVSNELRKLLANILEKYDGKCLEQDNIEQISIILHLLKRAQYLIETLNIQQKQKNGQKKKKNQSQPIVPYYIAKSVRDFIINFLYKFSHQISFKLFKLVSRLHLDTSIQNLNLILDVKGEKLKQYIKQIKMIKFYAESVSDYEMLILMCARTGIKLIQIMNKIVVGFQQMPQQKIMQQQSDYFIKTQEELNLKLKTILLLFDPRNSRCENKEKKLAHIYILIRILEYQAEGDINNTLSQDQNKQYISILQNNHQQLEQILTQKIKDHDFDDGKWFYQKKTGFMCYLLDNVLFIKEQEVCQSDKQFYKKIQMSICLLNMLKTLIDNSPQILSLTQKYFLQKCENSNKISELIVHRTIYGIKIMNKIIGQIQTEIIVQKQSKQQANNTSNKLYKKKQVQQYLKLSKKMYTIISKLLNHPSNDCHIYINLYTIIEEIVKLDECNSPLISIYVCREILNLSPIIQSSKQGIKIFKQISRIIFQYLIRIRQIYGNFYIESAIQITNVQQISNKAQQSNDRISLNVFINYFVNQFYYIGDKLISQNSKQEQNAKQNVVCQKNKKIVTFKCLQCQPQAQFCGNCSIYCHQNHPIIYVPNGQQLSNHCQCKDMGQCKLQQQNQKKRQKMPKRQGKSKQIKKESDLKPKQRMFKYVSPSQLPNKYYESLQERPQRIDRANFGQKYKPRMGQMIPVQFMHDPNQKSSYGMMRDRQQRQRLQRQRGRRQRQKMRELYQRQNGLFQYGVRGVYDSSQNNKYNPFGQEKYPQNWKIDGQGDQQQMQDTEELVDEDYEKCIQQEISKIKTNKIENKLKVQKASQPFEEYTYLLPIFLEILDGQIKQKSDIQICSTIEQITWNVKLQQPLIMNHNMLQEIYQNSNKAPIIKMCNPNTYQVKLRRPDASLHPSPTISRKNFVFYDKFVIFLSGLNINVNNKQKLLQYANEGKSSPTIYQFIYQHQLQYQAHSICITPDGNICTAGLHHLSIFGFQPEGSIQKHHKAKHSINNDNINKIDVCNYGILVGLSREIKMFDFQLKQIAVFKIPENLVKEWCCTPNSSDKKSYTIYLTINDGFIFYEQINSATQGVYYFKKKINDNRMNRPVGSFVLCKNIKGCGKILFASFKDKSIGHYIGRLDGSNLMDPNYIKLHNQGIDPLFDKHYCMGQTDIIQSPQDPDEFFMITIFKTQINDQMSIHRGILALIKFTKDKKKDVTHYQAQFIAQQVNCEYFSILKVGEKNEKKSTTQNPYWIVVSLHEDGSLLITNPFRLNESIFKQQIKSLKDRTGKSTNKKGDEVCGSNKIIGQKKDEYGILKNHIKSSINVKTLRDKAQELNENQHYKYLFNSEVLKLNQDYTMSANETNNTINYQITFKNSDKIITGVSFPGQGEVKLNSRVITDVFQTGFTIEESLYHYAFGVIKFSFKRNQNQKYLRNVLKDDLRHAMKKKNLRQGSIQERIMFCPSSKIPSQRFRNSFVVYGQSLSNFKEKVPIKFKQLFTLYEQQNQLFSLSPIKKISYCLKTCDIFLTSCLVAQNYDNMAQPQIIQFVTGIRENLLRKKNQNMIGIAKQYQIVKKIIIKALTIYEKIKGKKLHIFNDDFHPLRFATQIKIEQLYDVLNKNQISNKELIYLVNQLFELIQPTSQANYENSNVLLFCYYIAKYPSMLMKIHKKLKIIENQGIIEKLVPIYLVGHEVLTYLKYHTEWVIPAVYQVVGKQQSGNGEKKPKFQCRKLLYKYLKQIYKLNLEAWLKNVPAINAQQCMKQVPILNKQVSNSGKGVDLMQELMKNMGGGEMDDFDMQMKMALQLSKMQMKADQPEFGEQIPMEQEQNFEMQEIQNPTDQNNIPAFMKDLIRQCLKDIDFNANSLQINSQKAIIIYVTSKLAHERQKYNSEERSLLYLFKQIRNVVKKITQNYQQAGNSNIHNVIMLWMDLFGFIFRRSRQFLSLQEGQQFSVYSEIKDQIMDVLKHKIRVQEIKKYQNLPKMLYRLFNGKRLATKAPLVYGLIKVLQPPCEINYVLLTLQCYWLFPQNKDYYNKTKYTDTIRENQKLGNIQKIYDTALTNTKLWQQVGDPEWLMQWVQQKKADWPKALELLSMIYGQG